MKLHKSLALSLFLSIFISSVTLARSFDPYEHMKRRGRITHQYDIPSGFGGGDFSSYRTRSQSSQSQIKGFLKAPIDYDDTPSFPIFFYGKRTENDAHGLFNIPVDEPLNRFNLLLCSEFSLEFDKVNTIKHLAIHPSKDHHYYEIFKDAKGKWTFRDVKEDLKQKNFTFDENCLVIMVSPKFVERLEPWEPEFSANYIVLPKIVLKSFVKGKGTLQHAADKAKMRAVNHHPYHRRLHTAENEHHGSQYVVTSMTHE